MDAAKDPAHILNADGLLKVPEESPKIVEEEEDGEDEQAEWEPDQSENVPLTKEAKQKLVFEALEKAQRCGTADEVQKNCLEHDSRSYQRIMRLVVNRDPNTGAIKYFYSLRGFSIEEVERLRAAGFNHKSEDVIFREGQPSWIMQVEPHASKIKPKEMKKIQKVLAQAIEGFKKQDADAKKARGRPVMMANNGVVTEIKDAPPSVPPPPLAADAKPGNQNN